MTTKELTTPLFDEVWCAKSDKKKVTGVFSSTPVVEKAFVPAGKAILVKRDNVVNVSGLSLSGRNGIVGIYEF